MAARVTTARRRALWAFEVRAQWREPLTTLYFLVFLLLAFGYASSDAVALVAKRGAVPRTSPWALMLAVGGLTAFGQVITTMIVTTAMLRDEAYRTSGLLATTGVDPRTWFVARAGAALTVMLLVYAGMPVGILLGSLARAVGGAGDVAPLAMVSREVLRATAVITLPTMVVVTAVLAAAAVRTQRVLGVLVAALALVAVWQLALTLVAAEDTRTLGALLDPFGTAPVLAVSQGWPDADKAMRPVPVGGLLLANRALWSVVAVAAGTVVLTRWRGWLLAPAAPVVRPGSGRASARLLARLAAAPSARASRRHFTRGWITLDGGWRAVSVLALLNAAANAWGVQRHGGDAAAVLEAVQVHARLFLILLATVYAGELVWRERDVRVDQVLDAIGGSAADRLLGPVVGLAQAQFAVIGPLALLGAALALVARPALDTLPLWAVWTVFVLWLPFGQLTALSLAVHVWLDHKVAAHLLLITGWVLAVVLDRHGVAVWWLRFAEPAPLLTDGALVLLPHAQRGAWWSTVGAALCWWACRRWPTGTERATSR